MSAEFRTRIETALQLLGDDWMDRGEQLLGLERGELRLIERAEGEAAEVIEDLVSHELRSKAEALEAEADKAAADAAAFDVDSRKRRTAIEMEAIKTHEELVDRLLEICHPNWTPEAAA